MVVLTIVTQNNGEPVYFSPPIPKVHFIKLLACSIYNSWGTLKEDGAAGFHTKSDSPATISKLPAGNYNLDVLAKKITNLFLNAKNNHYDGLIAETNTPLGQLVLNNIGDKKIGLDQDLAGLLGTNSILPLMTIVRQRVIKTTAYFIHCDLIDGNHNLYNGKRSSILAKVDITGKPYEKVRYETASSFPFRDCSTDSHVNSITLSVRNQDGELFDFKGMPLEFELELN